jgi:hypothetical protein
MAVYTVKFTPSRLIKKLGFAGPLRLYDLRHTALTRLAQSGADVFSIQKIAGHSDIRVTSRYVHPTPEHIKQAFSRLQEYNNRSNKAQETRKGPGRESSKGSGKKESAWSIYGGSRSVGINGSQWVQAEHKVHGVATKNGHNRLRLALHPRLSYWFYGATRRDRTGDLLITNPSGADRAWCSGFPGQPQPQKSMFFAPDATFGKKPPVGTPWFSWAELMATLFLGMEPGQMWNIREDQLPLVNADSAAKSGFAFYRVDVQCDMLNLSWDGQ